MNNARNLKLSIILAKLKDVQVYVLSLSTLLQYLFTRNMVGKIRNQKPHMYSHITMSFQNCNFKLRNFLQSHSRSDFYFVKDRKPALWYIGLPRVYIHRDVFVFVHMDCLELSSLVNITLKL